MPHIIQATSAAHIAAVQQLFKEYETFLDGDLCFQDFENELATLPGKYAPPRLKKRYTWRWLTKKWPDVSPCVNWPRIFAK